MNKRNIALAAAIFALIAVVLSWQVPVIKHSELVGMAYLPALWLMVALSGGHHSPGAGAVWTSFLAYTLIYLVVFIVSYAFLLELYLIRKALRQVDAFCDHPEIASRGTEDYLETLGGAVAELEARRRRSWFLNRVEILETGEPTGLDAGAGAQPLAARPRETGPTHRHVAAHALTHLSDSRAVSPLLKHLRKRLTARLGPEQAGKLLSELTHIARLVDDERRKP
jgi:hypothetical protein